jgi:hypothetical protein
MSKHTLLSEPDHVDEPQQVQDYWGLVSRVAATQHPVIVRRGGEDVAVVIPVGYCWSTLRIVLDDLKSAKPHLCCRQSGSRLCEMPLMKAFYIFLLQEQFL